MEAQETTTLIESGANGRKTLEHFDQCAKLKQHASRISDAVRLRPGPAVVALRRRGVCVQDYGKGDVVECLSQQFHIEQQFVWLDKSATLGLALRAVRIDLDPSKEAAQLILRADGQALVRGSDLGFKRSVVTDDEIDGTLRAFLTAVADSALVGLPRSPF